LAGHGFGRGPYRVGVTELPVLDEVQLVVEPEPPRNPRGHLQSDDLVVGDVLQVLDEGPDRVAVRHDEDPGERAQVPRDGVLPVGDHPDHDVGQALGVGEDARGQAPVTIVVEGVGLAVA